MPSAVRNFWVDVKVDGREAKLADGPRSKDGGATVSIYQIADGEIKTAFNIRCQVTHSGNLITSVFDDEGVLLTSFQTKR